MISRTLATAVMSLVFATSIYFNFSQAGSKQQSEFSFTVSNKIFALFMPVDSLITSELASSNDESC